MNKRKTEQLELGTNKKNSQGSLSSDSENVSNMSFINTNMYQKPPINADLNQILSNLAIGDTSHDFGYKNSEMNASIFKNSYNNGIPSPGFDEINNEEVSLSSVIQSYTKSDTTSRAENLTVNTDGKYIPMASANLNLDRDVISSHSITTINNYEYSVNYSTVKTVGVMGSSLGSKEIDAVKFFENLDLNDDRNIAIVVDAASIGLIEILSSGSFEQGKRPNVYYIYGAEVVNDPATKKHPDSKDFIKKTGVNFIPCISMNPSSFVYSYSFTDKPDINTIYLEQFFTNYKFDLSDTKSDVKGKSISYTTDLTVTSGSGVNTFKNPLIDSKSKNDITFLSSILNQLMAALTPPKNKFLFNSSLQQKRSGDWLQVLLCAGLRDKSRAFKAYEKGVTNLTGEIQRVFFVTHDRIALAFALLNGIDCIFTHHHSQKHLHSAFIYKLKDPIKQKQNKIDLANNYKSKIDEIKIKITNLISKVRNYQNDLYDSYVNSKVNALNTMVSDYCNKFITIKESYSSESIIPFDVQYNFNKVIQTIFSSALIIIFYKKYLPDLSSQLNWLINIETNSFSEVNNLLNIDNSSELATAPEEPINSNKIIQNYNELFDKITNIENLINEANSGETSIQKNTNDFTKSLIYKSADGWNWDSGSLSRRDIPQLTNISDTKNYGSDRNIFLYNIGDIDNILKQQIVYLFKEYYDFILSKSEVIVPTNINKYFIQTKIVKGVNQRQTFGDMQFTKFKAVGLSFCVEVLISLGGNGVNIDSVKQFTPKQIIDTIDSFLSKGPELNALITDNIVVQEDVDYNISIKNKTFEGGLDSFTVVSSNDKEQVEQIEQPMDTEEGQTGGALNTSGAFEITTKQVTYPLFTCILNSDIFYITYSIILRDYLETPENNRETVGYVSPMNRTDDLSQIPNQPEIPIPTSSIASRVKRGGGSINISENLKKLYESLPKNNSQIISLKEIDESNVFKSNNICFHPLLPIYMITQSYYSAINNEDILSSMDFEIFVNYFNFLKKIKENLVASYSGENNNNANKLDSYAIGIALKQLLFLLNNTEEGYKQCLDVLGTTDDIYSNSSSLTENLAADISGKIILSDIDKEEGSIYLESELFKIFAKSLDVNTIFKNIPESDGFDLPDFKEEVFKFSVELGEQIIADRNGVEPRTFQQIMAQDSDDFAPMGIQGISSEERAKIAAKGQANYESNLAKGIPFKKDNKKIVYGKDVFSYSQGDSDKSNMITSTTSSDNNRLGGKKSRKYKNIKKNKTRKHYKSSKNKTKQNKKVKKGKNRKTIKNKK